MGLQPSHLARQPNTDPAPRLSEWGLEIIACLEGLADKGNEDAQQALIEIDRLIELARRL